MKTNKQNTKKETNRKMTDVQTDRQTDRQTNKANRQIILNIDNSMCCQKFDCQESLST